MCENQKGGGRVDILERGARGFGNGTKGGVSSRSDVEFCSCLNIGIVYCAFIRL